MKRWFFVILGVIVIAGGVYIFGPLRSQRLAAAQASLQTTPAARGSLTATVGATGLVRANQSAVLSWQSSGTVGAVIVRVGDTVASGDILATIEQTTLPQPVIMAQADLVTAQRALDDLMNSQLQAPALCRQWKKPARRLKMRATPS